MLKLLQKEFILETSRIQSERMGTVNHMKDLYDAEREPNQDDPAAKAELFA